MKKTYRKFHYSGFDRAMIPVIFALAWPTMLEQFMQTAVQYIDTAMVSTLGTHATAAVGSTGTVNWLIESTISAIGIGFLYMISQSIGANKILQAKKAASQAVFSTILIGIFFTVLTCSCSRLIPIWMQVDPDIQDMASRYFLILYSPMLFRTMNIILGTVLRSAGDAKSPMIAGISMNIINIILNFFLIYDTRMMQIGTVAFQIPGAGWGIEGAATASAISYTCGGLMITWKLWHHNIISPKGQSLRPDLQILKPCLRVAFPNMMQRFATSLGYVAFASMINSLGEISTAAHTIANTVESAFYIPGWGMQTAAATLSGNARGAGDDKRLYHLSRTIIPLEIGLMLASGGMLFVFAPNLMRVFTHDPQVLSLGSTVLRMVAISEPFYGVPIVLEGMMQGLGKTMIPFLFNIIGMWGVRIVGTFLCIHFLGLGLIAAWGCMIAHNLLLFLLYIILFASGRWK